MGGHAGIANRKDFWIVYYLLQRIISTGPTSTRRRAKQISIGCEYANRKALTTALYVAP